MDYTYAQVQREVLRVLKDRVDYRLKLGDKEHFPRFLPKLFSDFRFTTITPATTLDRFVRDSVDALDFMMELEEAFESDLPRFPDEAIDRILIPTERRDTGNHVGKTEYLGTFKGAVDYIYGELNKEN